MTRYASSTVHLAARVTALLAVVALAGPTVSAASAAPMVIPQNQPAGQKKLSPPAIENDFLRYPQQGDPNPPQQWAALTQPGYVTLFGDTVTRGVVWDDVGSGLPTTLALNMWRFDLPGLYNYHCDCPLNERGEGKIYVVGPRPRVTAVMISPDNATPVSYTLDGSSSSVTDWTAHNIVEYGFDVNNDGFFNPLDGDQVGPEPTAPVSFTTPGEHVVQLRVKDDIGRVNQVGLSVFVPKQVTAPAPVKTTDDLATRADTGAKFEDTYKKAKVAVRTRSKIKLSVLRKNGLSVKVTGLRSGDVVTARLTKGKKIRRSVGSRSARASGTTVTLRVRLSKKAMSILRAKPKAKLVRLGVKVEGSDGFITEKAKNVRFS